MRKNKMHTRDITLVQTCAACPEQYNAVDRRGKIVGYLRLRWGSFSVYCPNEDEQIPVYECIYADAFMGKFPSDKERKKQLRRAKKKIARWWDAPSRKEGPR